MQVGVIPLTSQCIKELQPDTFFCLAVTTNPYTPEISNQPHTGSGIADKV